MFLQVNMEGLESCHVLERSGVTVRETSCDPVCCSSVYLVEALYEAFAVFGVVVEPKLKSIAQYRQGCGKVY